MPLKPLCGIVLVTIAALIVSGAFMNIGAKSAEFDAARFDGFGSHRPRLEPVPQPRRMLNWRAGNFEAPRRPAAKVACVSLACPGFVLLGVGF